MGKAGFRHFGFEESEAEFDPFPHIPKRWRD